MFFHSMIYAACAHVHSDDSKFQQALMTLFSTFYVQLELVGHIFQDYLQHHIQNY